MDSSKSPLPERRHLPIEVAFDVPTYEVHGLTGLPNREALYYAAGKAIETTPGHIAVAMADINDLKHINDTDGHLDGDEYIKTTAEAMASSIREDVDVVGVLSHFGGDEFAFMFADVNEQDTLDSIMGRIKHGLHYDYGIDVSMGGRPHISGENVHSLFNAADQLMYLDKEASKLKKYTGEQISDILRIGDYATANKIELRDVDFIVSAYRRATR